MLCSKTVEDISENQDLFYNRIQLCHAIKKGIYHQW